MKKKQNYEVPRTDTFCISVEDALLNATSPFSGNGNVNGATEEIWSDYEDVED